MMRLLYTPLTTMNGHPVTDCGIADNEDDVLDTGHLYLKIG